MKTSLGLVPHLYSPVTSSLSFIHTYHNLHFVRLFVGFHLPIQTHESRDQAWFCFPFYLQSLAHSKHVVGAHYLLAAEFSELLPLSPWQPLTQLSTPTILKHSLPLLLDSSSSASPSLVSFFSLSHVGSFSSLSSLKVSVPTGEIHTMEYYSARQRDKLLMHTKALGDMKGIRLWEVLGMMKLLYPDCGCGQTHLYM